MNDDKAEVQDEEDLKLEEISSESPIKKKRELYKIPRPTFEVNPSGQLDKRISTPQTGTNPVPQKEKHYRDSKSFNSSNNDSNLDLEIPKIQKVAEPKVKGSKSSG